MPDPEFADDAQRLSAPDLDRHTVDRLDVPHHLAQKAPLDREPHLEVVGADHDVALRAERRRVDLRLGGDEFPRIGVLRRGEDLLDRAVLDDLAVLHHADPVRDFAHDAEIVGDEQDRHAEPGLELLEELEDLRLHGDVERGGRFVGDQEVRLVGQRHRDHDPLPLAAGELVRETLQAALRIPDPDLAKQFDDAGARRATGQSAVQEQDFADLLTDGVERIERRHRFLEHDGDVLAAYLPDFAFGQFHQVASLELDHAAGVPCGRIGEKPHDGESGRRLAGP